MLVATGVLLSGAPAAAADYREAGAATFDVVVLRPVGFVAFVASAVAFLPAALISAPMAPDATRDAWNRFVMERFDEVFRRPLGEF